MGDSSIPLADRSDGHVELPVSHLSRGYGLADRAQANRTGALHKDTRGQALSSALEKRFMTATAASQQKIQTRSLRGNSHASRKRSLVQVTLDPGRGWLRTGSL